MDKIRPWQPDPEQIGIKVDNLDEWFWLVLPECKAPKSQSLPVYLPLKGEASRHITTHITTAGNHFFSSRLFLAVPDTILFQREAFIRYDGLAALAEAPKHWLFGPQGEVVLELCEWACKLGDAYWNMFERQKETDRKAALFRCRQPNDDVQKYFNNRIPAAQREGALVLALTYAEQEFYGRRIAAHGRDVTSNTIAYVGGSGSVCYVVPGCQPAVAATDNALRWLIMRDVLPASVYKEVAEPWRVLTGRSLHPDDD